MEPDKSLANIKVIGVGGGAFNVLRRLAADPTPGVEYLACNTHNWPPDESLSGPTFLKVGQSVRIPWPSGEYKIESGRRRAECPLFQQELKRHLKDADLAIMTTGMGGVTGTGGSPVIARIVKEMGIPLLALVNTPYTFEGSRRSESAAQGIHDLKLNLDNVITIPCDFSLRCLEGNTTIAQVYRWLSEIMAQVIGDLVRVINGSNTVCISAGDVIRIIHLPCQATIAFGLGTDPDCPALDAVRKTIANTVECLDLAEARGALVSFAVGPDTRIEDCSEAVGLTARSLDPQAVVAFGVHTDSGLGDAARVNVIATGVAGPPPPSPPEPAWLKKLREKWKS